VEKIVDQIYVGGDADVTKAEERGYSRLACCKDGPDGHRMMLGYNSLGAPKDDNYLFASRKHWGAMNLIDHDDVDMIPEDGILEALAWAKKEYDAERTILFHCNAGVSRGPTMALMFMRTIGEMPTSFNSSVKIFRSLYPKYDPGVGMKQRAYMLWDELLTLFKKD
jgi:hypothetical protein